jgi:hypothetical protein
MGNYTREQVLEISKAYALAFWVDHSLGRFHEPPTKDILRWRDDYFAKVPKELRENNLDQELRNLLNFDPLSK